ncbi:hypothetical protein BDQ12DRAFT_672045, partial [Crucibulum laeve]
MLFIGAEGALGIVTKAAVTIHLAPLLPTTVAIVHFPEVWTATEAVIDIMNQVAECVKLLDDLFMAATNKYSVSKCKWPEKDSLFFKLQGPTEASILETVKVVKKVIEKH